MSERDAAAETATHAAQAAQAGLGPWRAKQTTERGIRRSCFSVRVLLLAVSKQQTTDKLIQDTVAFICSVGQSENKHEKLFV